jgi:hypothetical protein
MESTVVRSSIHPTRKILENGEEEEEEEFWLTISVWKLSFLKVDFRSQRNFLIKQLAAFIHTSIPRANPFSNQKKKRSILEGSEQQLQREFDPDELETNDASRWASAK